ncbi:restriction endonuclease FokI C-terminal domain-containing protein [Streptococcus parasuis]|uniref:restriction endonuclease FokI C-terminal domain-containing protein n=1 Tax=Streptococcus TaxID=1301 RepID=UPI001375288E|nr:MULTISPECIES: restriction endonuclease FokI C-terminal domain-containing protein [Streptococcus]MDG3181964.1 restriction endonuclease [Streptococcus suis]KAF1154679.1 restriction endonuclease [Streptococcus agalactiae]KAF1157701.1 restriction endonuclease [Streptococcus agalactiae]WDM37423.1 restriction endonuclease [Streptococcus parasuis]WJQ85066.1 restriction endonuclease FokI C-terminal domain-containing protein [Streptococcus parasuis]
MKTRTYGWVQNPSSFSNLKKVVKIFDKNSDHYIDMRNNLLTSVYFTDVRDKLQDKLNKGETIFSYTELVGTSRNSSGKSPKKRSDAVADALIQISILPQGFKRTGKTWTDNWTADGFLRWAVSLNFVSVDRESDTFSITPEGLVFVQTADDSKEEKKVLQEALLAYPPAIQVLRLLAENKGYCTKFYLGERLGFRGERGFTSYDEELMFDWLGDADDFEKRKIKSDVEGSSDKYARQICNWLKNVGLLDAQTVKRTYADGSTNGFQGYKINGRGLHALRQAEGSSKNSKHIKFLMWEFLATNCENRDYVRTRRAYILKFLQETNSFSNLLTKLNQKGFTDEKEVIESDIQGLVYFGLSIDFNGKNVVLKDTISDFSIPDLEITKELKNEQSEKLRSKFLKLTNLPMKYLELLDIAFDGKRNRDFEIVTMDLFRNVYKLNAKLLGGGRKPDGLIYTDGFGVIVDTKAYGEGYSKNINQADEMIRYIEDNKRRDLNRNPIEWWKDYPDSIPVDSFYFMWVSSKFVGKFQEQLEYTANETQTLGGALNVEQLLLGADLVAKGQFDAKELHSMFNNKEIVFDKV